MFEAKNVIELKSIVIFEVCFGGKRHSDLLFKAVVDSLLRDDLFVEILEWLLLSSSVALAAMQDQLVIYVSVVQANVLGMVLVSIVVSEDALLFELLRTARLELLIDKQRLDVLVGAIKSLSQFDLVAEVLYQLLVCV